MLWTCLDRTDSDLSPQGTVGQFVGGEGPFTCSCSETHLSVQLKWQWQCACVCALVHTCTCISVCAVPSHSKVTTVSLGLKCPVWLSIRCTVGLAPRIIWCNAPRSSVSVTNPIQRGDPMTCQAL